MEQRYFFAASFPSLVRRDGIELASFAIVDIRGNHLLEIENAPEPLLFEGFQEWLEDRMDQCEGIFSLPICYLGVEDGRLIYRLTGDLLEDTRLDLDPSIALIFNADEKDYRDKGDPLEKAKWLRKRYIQWLLKGQPWKL